MAKEPKTDLVSYLSANSYSGTFSVKPYVSLEADFMAVFFSEDFCYAEQLTDGVTIYRAVKTGEIVGMKIYGIRKLLEHV